MKSNLVVRAIALTGMATFMMAASVSASTITYSTNTAGTGFGGTSLTMNSISGAPATLTFSPNAVIATGIPSFVNFGIFTLACPTCTVGSGAVFGAFTFDLIIADITDGASGRFVGTSAGGNVEINASTLAVNWAPLVLGPGTTNALTGNFGTTVFTTTVFTAIVAPNSGTGLGESTVQGYVDASSVPEPATLALVGGALLALGTLRRKFRQSA